jgi:hypothetical protein
MKLCNYCNSNHIYKINSLKHYFFYCLDCKNIKSFSKNKKTVFNYISFIFYILDKIFKTTLRDMLCYYNTSAQDQYSYYLDVIKNHRYEDTKWFNYDQKFIKFLNDNLINLNNKKLISISEEPGFFYQLIKNKCKKVVFTALNNSVAKIMQSYIGVDTITYDANNDDISKQVNDKFDIILIRSVIGHINNLEKFIEQIKNITHNNTIIICSFHTPSKQSPILFGYDDYTINCLLDIKYVKKLFEKNNFIITKIITKTENLLEKYYYNKRKGLLFLPLYYIIKIFLNTSLNEQQTLQTEDTNVIFIVKTLVNLDQMHRI